MLDTEAEASVLASTPSMWPARELAALAALLPSFWTWQGEGFQTYDKIWEGSGRRGIMRGKRGVAALEWGWVEVEIRG